MWVNGAAQWTAHSAGKKHRRHADPALQPRFTDNQRFWARRAARSLLYARYMALLRHLAG
eukprot:1741346-Lingulodinium_polyedra.AAC.1